MYVSHYTYTYICHLLSGIHIKRRERCSQWHLWCYKVALDWYTVALDCILAGLRPRKISALSLRRRDALAMSSAA